MRNLEISNILKTLNALVNEGGETYSLEVGMVDPETYFARITYPRQQLEASHYMPHPAAPLLDWDGNLELRCESNDSLAEALAQLNARCSQGISR